MRSTRHFWQNWCLFRDEFVANTIRATCHYITEFNHMRGGVQSPVAGEHGLSSRETRCWRTSASGDTRVLLNQPENRLFYLRFNIGSILLVTLECWLPLTTQQLFGTSRNRFPLKLIDSISIPDRRNVLDVVDATLGCFPLQRLGHPNISLFAMSINYQVWIKISQVLDPLAKRGWLWSRPAWQPEFGFRSSTASGAPMSTGRNY